VDSLDRRAEHASRSPVAFRGLNCLSAAFSIGG